MAEAAKIENGFAEVGPGEWLMGRSQPAASFEEAVRRRRTGWRVPDRCALDLVATSGNAYCSDALKPFLTFLPCAAPISAVSAKVLVAPASARTGASFVRAVPMSVRGGVTVTEFGSEWIVLATKSRVRRIVVEDGATLSARPESVVAWKGPRPTGFCPKLRLMDILLPRGPRNLIFHFHGPSVVWVEGSVDRRELPVMNRGRRVA
ncbi:MAG: hypothetical protein K6F50_10130 [Kiritimatiellae bacterium]|nr:hypothetical protein [Kiritimatiellia bacterium]